MAHLQIFFGSIVRAVQADTGPRPSGGIPATLKVKGRTRKDVAEARKRLGIEDELAVEIIEAVATRQAETNEVDAQKRFEELHRELSLRAIAFDGRYLEAMNAIRESLITQEIAARLRLKMREEEEIMVLLMLAAAVS